MWVWLKIFILLDIVVKDDEIFKFGGNVIII